MFIRIPITFVEGWLNVGGIKRLPGGFYMDNCKHQSYNWGYECVMDLKL